MLERDDALKICDTVLAHAKAAGAEDATVSIQSSVEAHARFADNRINTSGRSEDLDITVTVWVGRRRGTITGNDAGSDALKRMADDAVQVARVSPVHREYVPTLGPLDYPDARGFASATADVNVTARATSLEAVLAACRNAKVTGAGFHSARASAMAAATANGNRRYFRFERSRAERHRAQRRRDGIGLLCRRPLRSRPPRRHADRRAGRSKGHPLTRTEANRARGLPGHPRTAGRLRPDGVPHQ